MDAEPPPSFISALRELESPVDQDVLNLAATLGSHGGGDSDDDDDDDDDGHTESNRSHGNDRNHSRASNDLITPATATATSTSPVARLRVQLQRAQEHETQLLAQQQQHQLRLDRSRDRLRLLERQRDAVDQRDRLRRVMSRLSRLNDDSTAPPTAAAYGDRVPRQNSLYDWSPATAAAADAAAAAAGEAPRPMALVQAVRRHPRFAARTREPLPRHHADSATRLANVTPFGSAAALGSAALESATLDSMAIDRERRDMLSRADSYRRGFLDRSTSHAPPVSPVLEHTVKYLSRIRHAATIDDTLNCALDAGFLSKGCFGPDTDFITDTSIITPPADTSWLAPGAVLSGYQHATNVANTVTAAMHRFRILDGSTGTAPTVLPTLPAPSQPWISNPYSTRSPSSRLPDPQSGPGHQDRWPVKVTVHAVDWDTMTLSATMEAYNVPSHPYSHQSILSSSSSSSSSSGSGSRISSNPATTTSTPSTHFTRTSSITTYLEGEILDFNTHTLLTESFKSSAENDALYWRKLPPFADMNDDDIVRALTSRKWHEQVLSREWILMRWKERCFVKGLNKSTGDPLAAASPHSAASLAPASTSNTTNNRSSMPPTPRYTTQLQPSPYRIVRNPQNGRAQVEISPDLLTTTAAAAAAPSSTSTPTTTPQEQQQQQQQQPSSSGSSPRSAQHATFDDSGCGLTISGFYYVCLRRSDGALEGLYFDPQSSPYQCLRLESVRGGLRGAWAFR